MTSTQQSKKVEIRKEGQKVETFKSQMKIVAAQHLKMRFHLQECIIMLLYLCDNIYKT